MDAPVKMKVQICEMDGTLMDSLVVVVNAPNSVNATNKIVHAIESKFDVEEDD